MREGTESSGRPRVGISACLLGQEVRYDGGHRRDAFLAGVLGGLVEWVPVCPEVEAGLGTPREPMRLVRDGGDLRVLTVETQRDLTATLDAAAASRVAQLDGARLAGYVLKSSSPSCGLERVKVFDADGGVSRTGQGRFAKTLRERLPDLPIVEERGLEDPEDRERFVDQVFGYWRLRALFTGAWDVGALVRFHTRHKLLLLAHSPAGYRQLGRLVGQAASMSREELEPRYTQAFMTALAAPATRRAHTNVLQHMAGYFRRNLDRGSRNALADAIERYRRGTASHAVPLAMIRRHARARGVTYLLDQRYLDAPLADDSDGSL